MQHTMMLIEQETLKQKFFHPLCVHSQSLGAWDAAGMVPMVHIGRRIYVGQVNSTAMFLQTD
jgi:hypothetical protein